MAERLYSREEILMFFSGHDWYDEGAGPTAEDFDDWVEHMAIGEGTAVGTEPNGVVIRHAILMAKGLLDIGGECTGATPGEHARLTLMEVYGGGTYEEAKQNLQKRGY